MKPNGTLQGNYVRRTSFRRAWTIEAPRRRITAFQERLAMVAKTGVVWGIGLGIALAVGTQILTWVGLGTTIWFVVVTYLLVVLFITLGLKHVKRFADGRLGFVPAALTVVFIVLISRTIFQSYMFVYINYFDPHWVDAVVESWTQTMQDANENEQLITSRIDSFRQSWKPRFIFTLGMLGYAIPQLVLGLLISLFFVFAGPRKAAGPTS